MGRLVLIARLAARDLRRRSGQSVLLLLAITAATTVLTMALALHGVASQPYQQTRAATRGPDVVAYLSSAATAAGLRHAAGVTAASGPYPVAGVIVRARDLRAGAEAEGRPPGTAAVDQPKLTAGHWVRPGGVVLERTFAQALGVGVGDRVTLNGRAFTVAGIAVTAAQPPYPNLCYAGGGGCYVAFNGSGPESTGLLWMTEPQALAMGTKASPISSYVLNLRLADPASAPAFASRHAGVTLPGTQHGQVATAALVPWRPGPATAGLLVADEQSVLLPGGWLAALLAIASVAVLAGGRMAERTRRIGLLKAVGATPALVTAALLAENLALALLAAALGLTAGRLAAPLLTSPGAALVGSPGPPSLPPSAIALVTAVAVAVALAATGIPAIRAARTSTVSALADAARRPRRRVLLIGLSARLPVPLLLAVRLIGRRPRRALLGLATTAVTAMGIVAVLAFRATVDHVLSGVSPGLGNPIVDRDEQVLQVLTVVLILLTVLNAVVAAWATALDARRASAVAQALGATPRQVAAGIAGAQAIPALPGALLGVPLGLALFKAASSGPLIVPPAWWLAVAVADTVAAVAALASIPARMGARRPVAAVLQAETG